MLDKDIAGIKNILSNPSPTATKEELKAEKEAFATILELLAKERQEVENTPKEDVEKPDNKKVTE